MKALQGFIVKVDKHIEDEITYGSLTLKVDGQINHTRNAITKGVIHSLPINFEYDGVEVGCEIVFDPRITAQSNNKGVFSLSKYSIDEKEKLYVVPFLEKTNFAFAVKSKKGDWINISDHDISKPVEVEKYGRDEFGLMFMNASYDNMAEGVAEMHLPTKQSDVLGFKKGIECHFKKGIEWLIELSGEKFYAIRNRYVFTTKEILDSVN